MASLAKILMRWQRAPLENRDFHENVEVDENGDDSPYLIKVQMRWQKGPLLSGDWLISQG